MWFCFHDLLAAASTALDCVESELLGVTTHHGKRVACLCMYMGKGAFLQEQELEDLAGYALLHDNALTEYVQAEYEYNLAGTEKKEVSLAAHCRYGERNVRKFPFHKPIEGAVLYHHENADGSGPFGRKDGETPLYARLIHLADQLDARYDLSYVTKEKYEEICSFIKEEKGTQFGEEETGLFFAQITWERLQNMQRDGAEKELRKLSLREKENFSAQKIREIAGLFARITDYKSAVTGRHSLGIAEKAWKMGVYYGYEKEKCTKLYLAGALHDIGKLAVDVRILEKPGKLTEAEFAQMKRHVVISREILSKVEGFEEIVPWAANHHEKLDGTGYPLGLTGEKMGKEERLMACLDIYQALSEHRSYKASIHHKEVMDIMWPMAEAGKLDKEILQDMDRYFGA